MDFKDFSSLVMSRQACRSFDKKLIGKEKLFEICDLARFSPSACNSQPWKMYCVHTQSKIDEVTSALQGEGRNLFLSNAGGYVALAEVDAALRADVSDKFDNNHFVKYDVGELIAYLTLSAKTMGIESCVIGYVNQPKLKKALSIPNSATCNIVIAFGYSDIPIREKTRKPFEHVVVDVAD